jgi:cation diffusion facilitator CzcD-associated flavoprotein CzcO
VSTPRPARSEGFDAQACVIGAGAAGLAAGHALARRGVTFDWFEKGSMVGGLWRIDNDNGAVAAYKTLHLNSSRTRTQYPSFPMPAEWPDYPSHELMALYFESFAEHFDLKRRITFRAEVTSVEPLPGPGHPGAHGWAVTTTATGRRTYQHVLVANGHHSVPNLPTFPGHFSGKTFHAHDYSDPSVFIDRDVVVVGVGNSGMGPGLRCGEAGPPGVPGDPAWRPRPAQVRLRPADRHHQQRDDGVRAVRRRAAGVRGDPSGQHRPAAGPRAA